MLNKINNIKEIYQEVYHHYPSSKRWGHLPLVRNITHDQFFSAVKYVTDEVNNLRMLKYYDRHVFIHIYRQKQYRLIKDMY